VAHVVNHASRTATVTALGKQVADWTRASFCYRWLTKEPDPDVIVIDLRETYTVGPVIAALEWLLDIFVPASARSRVVTVAERIQQQGREAPVRTASLLTLAAVAGWVVRTALTGGLSRGSALGSLGVALLALLGTRVTMDWDNLCDTRLADWLRAVFEPPPPPEKQESEGYAHEDEAGETQSSTHD
jgi:hypothetical protein